MTLIASSEASLPNMGRTSVAIVLLSAFISVLSFFGAATASANLAGQYAVAGVNADGSTYSGQATISQIGNQYTVHWNISGTAYSGIGALQGNVFVVNWGQSEPISYAVVADGTLIGRWANGAATDVLVPQRRQSNANAGTRAPAAGVPPAATGVAAVPRQAQPRGVPRQPQGAPALRPPGAATQQNARVAPRAAPVPVVPRQPTAGGQLRPPAAAAPVPRAAQPATPVRRAAQPATPRQSPAPATTVALAPAPTATPGDALRLIIRRELGVAQLGELDGAHLCVLLDARGLDTRVPEYFQRRGMAITIVVFDNMPQALTQYEVGECDGVVVDAQPANGLVNGFQYPAEHMILSEAFSVR